MKKQQMAEKLKPLLADTYTLYLKTQNYHWNVVGKNFFSLHLLFEQHYRALAEAVDEIAERIRELGEKAPGSYTEFAQLTSQSEAKAGNAEEMILDLQTSHEKMSLSLHDLFEAAKTFNDESTQDLLVKRLEHHEKAAWMLKAHLG